MNNKFERMIDIISILKPECIDKENIKEILQHDMTWNTEFLDSLYLRKIIDIEEYKQYLKIYIKRLRDNKKFEENNLQEAEQHGNKYNPMLHYGCCFPHSSVIDIIKNS